MKALLAFSKDSAKKAFVKLRKEQYFSCEAVVGKIQITKKFLQHILFKPISLRTPYEIMERVLIFPFLEEVLQEGKIVEKREENGFVFYEIKKEYPKYFLSIILEKRISSDKIVLLSCFKDNKKKNSS